MKSPDKEGKLKKHGAKSILPKHHQYNLLSYLEVAKNVKSNQTNHVNVKYRGKGRKINHVMKHDILVK